MYAHNAYNCTPIAVDGEQFRNGNGFVRDLNELTKNAKLQMYAKSPMNAKSIYMNAKLTKLNMNINLNTMLYENSCLNISTAANRSTISKNVDESSFFKNTEHASKINFTYVVDR